MTIQQINDEIKYCEYCVLSLKLEVNSSYPTGATLDKLLQLRNDYKHKIIELKKRKDRLFKLERILK